MSVYSTGSPSFAAAVHDRTQRTDRNHTPAVPSWAWALLQALAYAGACIDPSGVDVPRVEPASFVSPERAKLFVVLGIPGCRYPQKGGSTSLR